MSGYFIWTIGCQMNKAESQCLAGCLDPAGCREVSSPREADLVVLNTCVVRQSAEDRVRGMLGQLKGLKRERPRTRIVVTGCFVDSDIKGLKRRFPYVDFFFKPGAYPDFIAWAEEQGIPAVNRPQLAPSPGAFIPIIQGCNNFCSFCIVPYRRGREVSRPLEEVICQAEQMAEQGVREITLLGQNVDSYGHDLPGKPDLADLLYRLNGIAGLLRIRFLTNHPKDVTPRLLEAVASLDRVCKYLELPLQSGDDDILRAMRRGYTAAQYRELIHTVRELLPQAALSTDVIVGFPGETEEQFEHTFSLLKEVRFDVIHIAAYSPRSGTIAAREYEDDVPAGVKKERLRKVEELHASIAGEINSGYVGKAVEVLVEGTRKGKWYGRTGGNKLVFFPPSRAELLASEVKVRIEKSSPWALQGTYE
jgi:tRNA-2-methylthio-N6-dimethylallyladenosine synthase